MHDNIPRAYGSVAEPTVCLRSCSDGHSRKSEGPSPLPEPCRNNDPFNSKSRYINPDCVWCKMFFVAVTFLAGRHSF